MSQQRNKKYLEVMLFQQIFRSSVPIFTPIIQKPLRSSSLIKKYIASTQFFINIYKAKNSSVLRISSIYLKSVLFLKPHHI